MRAGEQRLEALLSHIEEQGGLLDEENQKLEQADDILQSAMTEYHARVGTPL